MEIKFSDLDNMIVFANSSNGELVYIDDVKNGYDCNCVCLNCKGRLNAKNNGSIKAHHFAHASGSDCKKGHENTIPLFVQRILNSIKWILLPQGNILIDGKLINDYQTASINNIEIIKSDEYPSIIQITTIKNIKINIYVILSDDEYYDRKDYYKDKFENLIELDIREYRGTNYPVESTLKELLTHRKRKMKWINRYDESKLIKKINNISIWKSFGNDVYGNEHYYCFKSHLVVTNNEQDCRNCKYYIRNIINDCYQVRCLGFIKELSIDNIMKADKPNINNIEGPSYLKMHSKHVGSYDWMKLEDLPLSYEDIDYTLIYSKDDNRVFFVNLKSFTLNKKIGLMIMPDGSIEDSPTSLNRYSNNLCWRICTISSFKINKDHIELLSKYIQ